MGACKLTNVWWSAVCEDAFTIKKQEAGETTTISGGGAFGAEDKVLQHNGGGTLYVKNFLVEDFGKLYRSCGNCGNQYQRKSEFDTILANGTKGVLAGVPVSRLLPGAGLDNLLLVASTEVNTDDDRAAFVAALKEVL